MDDALLVRGFKRLGDLTRDGERLVQSQSASRNHVRKRRSVNQFEDERLLVARVLESVDGAMFG